MGTDLGQEERNRSVQGTSPGRDTEQAIQPGGLEANTWAQTQFHFSKWGNVDLKDFPFRIKGNNPCSGQHLAGR